MAKKQVVLIMTDTTRKDMLGCYGNSIMQTPVLDQLAEEGIRFDRTYSAQPVCGPARSALFTGVMPHTNGMIANSMSLSEGISTIGERLTEAGYNCGYIGKWHLDGGDYFGYGKCPEGYNNRYWYDMRMYLEELTDEERVLSRKGSTSYKEGLDASFTYAKRCTDRAVKFIEEYKEEDFFLTVSYDEPHDPSICPAPFNTMYEGLPWELAPNAFDTLENKPTYQKLWAGKKLEQQLEKKTTIPQGLARFLGCNSFVDSQVGRIVQALEKCPEVVIIYTSDHGVARGAHHLEAKGPCIYEEVAGVPLIIKGGEKGKVSHMPVSHLDITPTILDYMGVDLPKAMQGKSILPHIVDINNHVNEEVYCEFTRYEVDHDGFGGLQMMRAIIDERYKLAVHLLDTDELYDTLNDPYEMDNLINNPDFEEIRNKLHDKLLNFMNETRDPYRGYQWAVRPWRKDKVASWKNDGYTRQRETEKGEMRQLDYATGLEMIEAVRIK